MGAITSFAIVCLSGCSTSAGASSGGASTSHSSNASVGSASGLAATQSANATTSSGQSGGESGSGLANDSNQGSAAASAGSGTPAVSTTTVGPFRPSIVDAMVYVQHHGAHMPLMAPVVSKAFSAIRHMGVEATVSSDGMNYGVVLYATESSVPLNSSNLSSLPEMDLVGSFGATRFSTPAIAKSELYANQEGSMASAYLTPPPSVSQSVNLGHGMVGAAYEEHSSAANPYSPMVVWHEGDWTLEVYDASVSIEVQHAKKIVAYLNRHLLPETYGVFGENIAGDGDHASAMWAYGNTDYSVSSFHSGLQAVQMAVAMRVYPSGQRRP
ncbi:hypothetical protein [Alicyclobacillus sp. SP_1]|uniref:hypothetical protein n=1 Tax=Alicyclobacillus sp. SP_1 TaxID=2942475 RepID=UPI002157F018|nr:hypothetical protein [Alicyclobacillus sp. SP_1]